MRLRSDRTIAIAILVGAFLVRLVFILQTRRLSFYYHPVLDSGFFHQWATFKTNASWFEFAPAFREPLYAYFLASIYAALRESLTMARIVQSALGSVTALLIYSSARMIYGRLASAVAGIIFALSGLAIFFASEINETTLLVFLLVASAYLLLRAERSRPYVNAALSGLLLGAAFLTRFAGIAALPAWMAQLLAAKDRRLKRAALLMAAGFVVLPLCYQVLLVKGEDHSIVPLRTSWHAFLGGGSVGGTSKKPHYDIGTSGGQGTYRAIAFSDWADGQKDAMRLARIETGKSLSVGAASSHWRARALEDFKSGPGRYLRTYLTKLGIFWGPSVPPANVDSRYIAKYSFLLKNLLFAFAVIAPLGLVGRLRRGSPLAAALFMPLYSLTACLYLVTDSDKLVVIPFLAIFAGALVSEIVVGFRKHKSRKSFAYLFTVAIVGVALFLLPREKMDETRQLIILGDISREESLFDKAETAYRDAIKLAPEVPDAYIPLSKIYSSALKPEEALNILSTAAGSAARDPRVTIERSSLLLMTNRADEAVAAARPLESTYPYEPKLHEVMGMGSLAKGDMQGALAEFQQEIDYAGGGFVTYSAMGKAKLDLGQYEEAAGYLETALRFNSSNTMVAMQLADAYNKIDQYIKACDVLARVLAVDPGNMPLRFKFANSLYRAGRLEDALKQFRELSNFDPKNADFVLNMGTVYAAMDSVSLAIQTWEKALTLDPTNAFARENLKEARQGR